MTNLGKAIDVVHDADLLEIARFANENAELKGVIRGLRQDLKDISEILEPALKYTEKYG